MTSSRSTQPLLTADERKALLRCRYAGRYDRGAETKVTAGQIEEEQRASRGMIPRSVWIGLQRRGLITPKIPLRLTAAGEEALDDG